MTKALFGAHPQMLGFEELDRLIGQGARNDGYPPYNIVQTGPDRFRITIAVAGFALSELDVCLAEGQLQVRGARAEGADAGKVYLHRGIAARAFVRSFVLARGVQVTGAALDSGLLHIDLTRETRAPHSSRITIRRGDQTE